VRRALGLRAAAAGPVVCWVMAESVLNVVILVLPSVVVVRPQPYIPPWGFVVRRLTQ
jgi:hypothetical protein